MAKITARTRWKIDRVKISIALAVLLVAFIVASGFTAAKPEVLPEAKEPQRPAEQGGAADDPLGRSTPQGTVFGFMKSASQGNYDQALQYLDENDGHKSTETNR